MIKRIAMMGAALLALCGAAFKTGDYVMFCPPAGGVFDTAKDRGYIGAGFCPGGYGYMLKRILAAQNDTVCFTDKGGFVNGTLLAKSAPLKTDAVGRPLPRYHPAVCTLNSRQVLLMSDVSSTSYDGRYFGPVQTSQIKTVIHPVIIW